MPDKSELRFGFKVDTSGLDLLQDAVVQAVRIADRVVAEELLLDSRSYVPILTGALVDSGRVEELPRFDEAVHIVRVVYGQGESADYAETQHDDVYNHPQLGFRGRALYLKKPFELNYLYYMELHRLTLQDELARRIGS